MSGTKAGGKAAAITNKAKHGAGFYAEIGALGGKAGNTGGFASNRELARTAGAKGGRTSRRWGVNTHKPTNLQKESAESQRRLTARFGGRGERY